jgi:hypothetical protein
MAAADDRIDEQPLLSEAQSSDRARDRGFASGESEDAAATPGVRRVRLPDHRATRRRSVRVSDNPGADADSDGASAA